MATQSSGTVVGVFSDHDRARQAIKALKDSGFTENQIGIASAHSEGLRKATDSSTDDDSYVAEGATAGVAAGAGLGALWGLGILAGALPAIGPAIAGGTLAAILSSAAAGAAAAGLTGALIGMGVSKDEAEYYESELKSGRSVVTVSAGSRRAEAQSILQRFGAYDMATRTSAVQPASSMSSRSTNSMSSSTATPRPTSTSGNTVQAREEELHVDKTRAKTGEVRVRKETHTEHKTIDVPVTREEVVIERRAVGGKAAAGDAGRDEIRIPVSEEQVNVEKQTVVKEEVTVGKRKVQDTKRVSADLKKEEIKVDTQGSADVRNKSK